MEFAGTVIFLALYALLFASYFWRKFARYLLVCICFHNLQYLIHCILERPNSPLEKILSTFVILAPILLTVDLKLALKNTLFEVVCSCIIIGSFSWS